MYVASRGTPQSNVIQEAKAKPMKAKARMEKARTLRQRRRPDEVGVAGDERQIL